MASKSSLPNFLFKSPGINASLFYHYFSQTLVNIVREGAFCYDEEFRIILWNPVMEKITGYRTGEALGKLLFELFPSLSKESLSFFLQEASGNEAAIISANELHLPGMDETGTFNAKVFPLNNEKDVLQATLCILHKKTEDQATNLNTTKVAGQKDASLYLEKILNSSLDGIVALEAIRNEDDEIADFRYILINKKGQEIIGLPEEEVVGNTLLTLFPHVKSEGLLAKFVTVAQTGNPLNIEIFYPYDRLNHWLKIVAVAVEKGVVLTFSDITKRKLDELRILENEASMQEVQELAHLGNFEWDIKTDDVKWSKELYHLYGVNPREASPNLSLYLSHIHPEDLSSVVEMLERFYKEPKPTFFEHRIVTGNHQIKFVRGKYKPVFSDKGELIKAFGYCQDITEVKKVELDLSGTLEQLHEAQKLANMGAWRLDLTTGIYHWSDECCRILGLEKGITLSLHDSGKFIHPEDAATVVERIKKAISEKSSFVSEHRVLKPDGQLVWMNVFGKSVLDGKGQVIAITGVGQDITDKKENVLALEKLNYHHELILSSVEEGIFGLDKNGNSTFVNKKALELTGYTTEELLGYQQHTLIHHSRKDGSHYPENECPVFNVLQTGKAAYTENETFWRKDGTPFPVEFVANPIYENGVISGVVVTFKDVSEKKLAQEKLKIAYLELKNANEKLESINNELEKKVAQRTVQLSKKNEELRRINSDLDNFIYTASHDLKAPINNIEGLVHVLTKSAANDKEKEKIIGFINESILRFKSTLKDLTEIAKEQPVPPEQAALEKTSIGTVLEEINNDIKDLVISSGSVIEEDIQVNEIVLSKKNTRSILYNLLSNAIKYCSPERKPVIKVSSYRHNSEFTVVAVKDNGLGIAEEDRIKLFSMFKRLHSHVEGTGIGLFLVKRMIENAGGKIELESEVGKGSIFRVYIKTERID